jgi:hypothetical protein
MPNPQLKAALMLRLKKILRIARKMALIYVIFVVIAGVILGVYTMTMKPDLTSFITDADVVNMQAFLGRQKLDAQFGEPSREEDELQLKFLTYDVGKFRDGSILTTSTTAMAELPEVMPDALGSLMEGEISAAFPLIWPYFMAGSFTVLGNALSNDPIVGIYNPYFDIVLITQWKFKDHTETDGDIGFKLVAAVPVTGPAFRENRSSLPTDQPVWANSDTIFETSIIAAAQSFISSFEGRYPPFSRESLSGFVHGEPSAISAAVSVAEDRIFAIIDWVAQAQNTGAPVNYAHAIEDLRDAFSLTYPDYLEELLPADNPQTADMFFQLDLNTREGLRPYLVIDKNVIFIDPINLPTAFMSVYFKPTEKDDEEYEPALVVLFDLNADISASTLPSQEQTL